MSHSDESDNPPPDRPDRKRPNEIGYKCPPRHHCFKPGQSGNPSGKRKRKPDQDTRIEKMKDIVLEEAYRPIKVREGDKVVELPALQAALRTNLLNAAKGDRRALKDALPIVLMVEAGKQQDRSKNYAAALEYKLSMKEELEHRQREGITGPDPIPHPDDIILNPRNGTFEIRGPVDKKEKAELDSIRQHYDNLKQELQDHEKDLASARSKNRKADLEAEIKQIKKRLKLFAAVVKKYNLRRDDST